MTTRNIIQLIDIPDFRFTNQDPDINYADVADDCDSKPFRLSKQFVI